MAARAMHLSSSIPLGQEWSRVTSICASIHWETHGRTAHRTRLSDCWRRWIVLIRLEGASFQTFARYRIRGAVFNGLRHLCESLAQGAQPSVHENAVRERIESLDEPEDQDPLGAFVATTVGLGLGFLLEAKSFPGREETPDAYTEFEKGELSTADSRGPRAARQARAVDSRVALLPPCAIR